MNKPTIYLLLSIFISNICIAQKATESSQQIEEVFNNLVLAYGSSKTAPELSILSGKNQSIPAAYYASPLPIIKIDINLLNVCNSFGEKRDDALSIIISHELAHYYNDHTFCTDFAFAVRKNNEELSNKLKTLSKTEKLALETEADHKGLFYACMSGYNPFSVYAKLLDAVYKYYDIQDGVTGYPTKAERNVINIQAEKRIRELYNDFLSGINAIKIGDYDTGIEKFEILNNYFPSRENYNNLGVARAKKARQYKPSSRYEANNSERFTYPIGIDNNSRLKQPSTVRGIDNESYAIMENLLKMAQKDFQEAIRLDDTYTQSYINLACVFDLMENPMASIGKIKELPKSEQQSENALQILAIAYYHLGMKEESEAIWKKLKL